MAKSAQKKTVGENREVELARTLFSKEGQSGKNLFERTVERLGSAIKHGIVAPGDRLPPERELATMMGISRTTVRSAIQILVEGGFLVSRRGRGGGTFVADEPPSWPTAENGASEVRSEREIQLVMEKRRVIECGVAELAAESRTDDDLRELRALVGEMAELIDDFQAFRARDTRFHLKIAQITDNPDLVRLSGDIQDSLGKLLAYLPPSREALIRSNQQHAEIVAAIAKADGTQARRTMREHVGATRHFMQGLLPV
ncbi:FadR/GntR family transcriptional regulator [Nitratireductor soli]|uniref:FadR/GntR family transcriptional regulator n=1 Tax=Nitratireductor soli TaxID=1670619 RepID=UPI00065E2F7A|nr:FadR/GntR family transcriptional regulator [Nitratireductor soli]